MSSLSTHVLDTTRGCPAAGIEIVLSRRAATGWSQLQTATTDDDGRVARLASELQAGEYRIAFQLRDYFDTAGLPCFFPYAEVAFQLSGPERHYHVPLLVSPYGYSTYRGS